MEPLYYKTDDGTYHTLKEIETVEELVTELDEKLLEGCEGISTIKDLREGGCFEADVKIPEGFMEELDNWIREIVNAHKKYYDISWICELAKRWLKEHAEIDANGFKEWTSCKKPPKTPVRVQVQLDNGWIITAYYDEGKWYAVPDWDEPLEGVLAWRPLPEPYVEGEDEHD